MVVDLWGPVDSRRNRQWSSLSDGEPRPVRYIFVGAVFVLFSVFISRLVGAVYLATQNPELATSSAALAAELDLWLHETAAGLLLVRVSQATALLSAVWFAARQFPGGWRALTQWGFSWKQDLALGLGLAVAFRLVTVFFTQTLALMGVEIPPLNNTGSIGGAGLAWAPMFSLLALTVTPLAQELFFRGLMLPTLARTSGAGVAVVASSLAYSLLYLQPTAQGTLYVGCTTFFLSVVAAGLFLNKRRMGAALIFHVGFNFTGITMFVISALTG